MTEIDKVVRVFSEWARLEGHTVASAKVRVESLGRPHKPATLSIGWQGVYAFRYNQVWLKVGRAGPNSGARWLSQHYNPRSASSNLAFSLIKYALAAQEHPDLGELRAVLRTTGPNSIGAWIKANTERVNILIPGEMGRAGLDRLETIAQQKLKPIFEGRWLFGDVTAGH
jgi:hypothetical protein